MYLNIILILTAASLSACSITPSKLHGKVLDGRTGVFIEGAAVSATWELITGPHGGSAGMGSAVETSTDRQGRFDLPVWRPGLFQNANPTLLVVKNGYQPLVLKGVYEDDLTNLKLFPTQADLNDPDNRMWFLNEALRQILHSDHPDCLWKKLSKTLVEVEKIKPSYKNGRRMFGIDDIPTTPLCGDAKSFFHDLLE